MSQQIVLKDALGANVTFNYVHNLSNGVRVYEKQDGPLLGRARLTLNLSETGRTNRVKWKLTVPTTSVNAVDNTVGIAYTQISSGDFSVFRAGTSSSRDDLIAMTDSLVASSAVHSMVKDGLSI